MTRIHHVMHARKNQGECRVCGKKIKAGDAYKWAQPRYKPKVIVCGDCRIKPTMISKSKTAILEEAMDELDQVSLKGLPDQLNYLWETAYEIAQDYQEAAESQREYFPNSSIADRNEEKASDLEYWADSVSEAMRDIKEILIEIEALGDKRITFGEKLIDIRNGLEALDTNEINKGDTNWLKGKLEMIPDIIDEVLGEFPG